MLHSVTLTFYCMPFLLSSPCLPQMVEYLVGDGPNNRYALICSGCNSHNGMALRDEFEYLTFRCAYCYAFNEGRKKRPVLERPPSASGSRPPSTSAPEPTEEVCIYSTRYCSQFYSMNNGESFTLYIVMLMYNTNTLC